jgi:hypothetical protein
MLCTIPHAAVALSVLHMLSSSNFSLTCTNDAGVALSLHAGAQFVKSGEVRADAWDVEKTRTCCCARHGHTFLLPTFMLVDRVAKSDYSNDIHNKRPL